MLPNGYVGKILQINLDNNKISIRSLDESLAERFFGGRCLAAKILFDILPPKIDPLSPENILIFATGPLTGSGVMAGNRYAVITKSPQTGLFLDTYAGGNFGSEIKFAGYDYIIIKGKSKSPSYISIIDDNVQIKSADKIWGLDCWEAEHFLKKDFGDQTARTAVIGPAGERLVKYALISSEHHQCGRGGAGAVMGSKNLKGLIIKGSQGIKIADPEGLLHFLQSEMHWILSKGPSHDLVKDITYNTPATIEISQELGLLPTYNFKQGQFEKFHTISGHHMREKIVEKDKACFSCNTPCNKFSRIKNGKYKGGKVIGPEYETLALLGSNVGIDNVEAVAQANILCDKLGIDTVSTGNIIGFLIECRLKNLVSKEIVDNLDLKFGNEETILALIEKIAKREGVGDLLAEGVQYVSKKIGKGSEKFVMHVKGMEYPGYVAGASPITTLEYAVTDRGGCHRRAWPVFAEQSAGAPYTTEGRAPTIKKLFDERAVFHCGILCDLFTDWSGTSWNQFIKMVKHVMGIEMGNNDLQLLADRCFTITRSFNVREGAGRKDDSAPFRTMEEKQMIGPAKGKSVTQEMLNVMLDEYYRLRGWDVKTGIPTKETLSKLGLSDIASDL